MDAREQLRRYLEQRRDLGESEFVLDGMSVEEALQMLGAIRRTSVTPVVSQARAVAAVRPSASAVDVVVSVDRSSTDSSPAVPVLADTTESLPVVALPATNVHAQPIVNTSNVRDNMPVKFTPGLVVGAREDNLFEENPFKKAKTLDDIAGMVDQCRRCDLYKTATKGVPGEGDPNADIMCVGEAPGANEDQTGRPFVGAAGQLLTKILAAIELKREDVFIANVLKHRPPGNRNPMPDEVAACSPYLVRQIELVKPKVIIAFGTFAAQTLLVTKTPIGKLRGMVHRYYGVPLVVTYHPAALLRNPAWKRPTWEDVQLARQVLDSAGK